MHRGLDGRRIALFDASGNRARDVAPALERAGARVHMLKDSQSAEQWHGGMYAALVIVGEAGPAFHGDPRLVQLVREFLVSDKPVAALDVPVDSIQADESLLSVRANGDARRFADEVVREFSTRLEEHDVDEMSELSFPASDPPATSPGSVGRVGPDGAGDREPDSRA